jgi:A/G-specific adenine glycosylase
MKSDFTGILIKWYRTNKRDLPWRETPEAYKVWLSEVILQQTRVAQGLSYYHRFVETFPTVHDLAEAPEEMVLKLWQGLGYYSRARNMHHTAKIIANDFGGNFPNTASGLEVLKGIGPYTAAAISSICFGEKVGVVDGNVNRVISRFFGVLDAVDTKEGKGKINSIVSDLVPAKKPGDFNQAMMEFGALLCTPQAPECAICPLETACYAKNKDLISQLPAKTPKKATKKLYIYYLRVEYNGSLFIRKRSEPGIWRNLYEFPSIESFTEKKQEEITEYLIEKGLAIKNISWNSLEYRHILSHRDISARVIHVKLNSLKLLPKDWIKTTTEELNGFAVSRLMEKITDNSENSRRFEPELIRKTSEHGRKY